MSYQLIKVNVCRKDTGESMSNIRVSLSLSGFETKTNAKGEAKFSVPSDSGVIDVYIAGSSAVSGYPYELRNIIAYVSSGGYFDSAEKENQN